MRESEVEGIEVENWEMKVVIWERVRREKMIRRRVIILKTVTKC